MPSLSSKKKERKGGKEEEKEGGRQETKEGIIKDLEVIWPWKITLRTAQ